MLVGIDDGNIKVYRILIKMIHPGFDGNHALAAEEKSPAVEDTRVPHFFHQFGGNFKILLDLVQTEYDPLVNSSQMADFLSSAKKLPHASVKQAGGGK